MKFENRKHRKNKNADFLRQQLRDHRLLSENKIAVTFVFAGVQRFLLLLQTIVFFSSLSIFGIVLILLFVMN